jgi:hypothetical protein
MYTDNGEAHMHRPKTGTVVAMTIKHNWDDDQDKQSCEILCLTFIIKVQKGRANQPARQAGSVSGLADSRVQELGYRYCSKSSEHPNKFRVATWNLGSLKKRSAEVVKTLTRRRMDLCVIQDHRWTGSLTAVSFAGKLFDKVFDVQRVSDRIIQIILLWAV